eukprot:3044618-Rhodomonas_salina.1
MADARTKTTTNGIMSRLRARNRIFHARLATRGTQIDSIYVYVKVSEYALGICDKGKTLQLRLPFKPQNWNN